ncbi:MAG: hypothetical protein ACK47B_14890, partial [Armatimonadota bacterium]
CTCQKPCRCTKCSGKIQPRLMLRSHREAESFLQTAELGLTLIGSGWFKAESKREAVEALRAAAKALQQVNWDEVQGFRAIPDPVGSLISGLAGAGDFDEAEAAARMLTELHGRSAQRESLVSALAAAGRLERALQLARQIEIAESRARALTTVAAAQAAARR